MAFSFGRQLQVSIFGQSHSKAIGVTVEGFPAGLAVDMDELSHFLARRAPGQKGTTPRKDSCPCRGLSGSTVTRLIRSTR